MRSNYLGSEEHKENCRKANLLGTVKQACRHCNQEVARSVIKNHEQKCLHDEANARYCRGCSIRLYEREKVFCSRNCAATHNNTGRKRTEVEKAKISEKLTGRPRVCANTGFNRGGKRGETFQDRICPECSNQFTVLKWKNKKYCNRVCVSEAMAKKSRKWDRCLSIPYTMVDGTVINLQSTWELRLAEHLDNLGVSWLRPSGVEWVDSKGKIHRYYADFYIPLWDVYLDPKNARVMEKDREKLAAVAKLIKLEYGHIDELVDHINLLKD